MISPAPSYHGYRFPPEIISHAVWLYHRFCLSFRDAEDLLAQRGVTVTRTTDLLITNKLLRSDPQKQAHIRGFADADRLYQGGYIFVGVSVRSMRILA